MATSYGPAKAYYDSGLQVIPIGTNKKPVIGGWGGGRDVVFQDVIQHLISRRIGIGILCGRRSGNLEVLDFDLDAKQYGAQWVDLPGVREVAKRLPVVETPSGGFHFYYRSDAVDKPQTLAGGFLPCGREKPIAETRGEGSFVVAPGGWAGVHPSGKPYVLRRGSLLEIPTITPDERRTLLDAARTLDKRRPKPEPVLRPKLTEPKCEGFGVRPGDDFNKRATWAEILEPHGWTAAGDKGWTRPGKYGGVSALADELFYCFSSSVDGIEPNMPYSKFAVFASLNHGGDFSAAASALVEQGYGRRTETIDLETFIHRLRNQ